MLKCIFVSQIYCPDIKIEVICFQNGSTSCSQVKPYGAASWVLWPGHKWENTHCVAEMKHLSCLSCNVGVFVLYKIDDEP